MKPLLEKNASDGWIHGGKYVKMSRSSPASLVSNSPSSTPSLSFPKTPLPPSVLSNLQSTAFETSQSSLRQRTPATSKVSKVERLLQVIQSPRRDFSVCRHQYSNITSNASVTTKQIKTTSSPPIHRFREEIEMNQERNHPNTEEDSTRIIASDCSATLQQLLVFHPNNLPMTSFRFQMIIEYLIEIAYIFALYLYRIICFFYPQLLWAVRICTASVIDVGKKFIAGVIQIFLRMRQTHLFQKYGGKIQSAITIYGVGDFLANMATSLREICFKNKASDMEVQQDGTPVPSTLSDKLIAPTSFSSSKKSPRLCVIKSQNQIKHHCKSDSKYSDQLNSFHKNEIDSSTSRKDPNNNPRRVLFSESEHGEVSIERFHYDKNLPASARKLEWCEEVTSLKKTGYKRSATEKKEHSMVQGTVPSASASDTLPLSLFHSPSDTTAVNLMHNSMDEKENSHLDQAKDTNQSYTESKSSHANKNSEEPCQDKIDHEKSPLGSDMLLSSITPLSKRYGRMKRQQQQHLPSLTGTLTLNRSDIKLTNKSSLTYLNAKKRRRELIERTSRFKVINRARSGTSTLSLSPIPLASNRPSYKRKSDKEFNRTNEWVWRLMHDIGEKENTSGSKKGKWSEYDLSVVEKSNNTSPYINQPAMTPSPSASHQTLSSLYNTPGISPENERSNAVFSFGNKSDAPMTKNNAEYMTSDSVPDLTFDSNLTVPNQQKNTDASSSGSFMYSDDNNVIGSIDKLASTTIEKSIFSFKKSESTSTASPGEVKENILGKTLISFHNTSTPAKLSPSFNIEFDRVPINMAPGSLNIPSFGANRVPVGGASARRRAAKARSQRK